MAVPADHSPLPGVRGLRRSARLEDLLRSCPTLLFRDGCFFIPLPPSYQLSRPTRTSVSHPFFARFTENAEVTSFLFFSLISISSWRISGGKRAAFTSIGTGGEVKNDAHSELEIVECPA